MLDSKGLDAKHASRRDIVLTLSDKLGGAHFDEEYDSAYYRIQMESGWRIIYNSEEKMLENNSYAETVFVIAQEFLDAISFYKNHKTLKPQDVKSNFNMVCIDYPGNTQKTRNYRYAYNPKGNLNTLLRISYDYYREAKYLLHNLFFRRFLNDKNQMIHQVLMVDNSSSRPLHYLITEKERYVLLGDKDNLYRVIEQEDDINTDTPGLPFDSLMIKLTGGLK